MMLQKCERASERILFLIIIIPNSANDSVRSEAQNQHEMFIHFRLPAHPIQSNPTRLEPNKQSLESNNLELSKTFFVSAPAQTNKLTTKSEASRIDVNSYLPIHGTISLLAGLKLTDWLAELFRLGVFTRSSCFMTQ